MLLQLELGGGQLGLALPQIAVRADDVLERGDEEAEDLLVGADGELAIQEEDLDAELELALGLQTPALHDAAHAGDEDVGIAGLREEVVGPALEPLDDVHRIESVVSRITGRPRRPGSP